MAPTHKGWLLFCPIYLADVESDGPQIEPRWASDWWLNANIWLMNGCCEVAHVLGFDAQYMMVITGEVKRGPSA